jgi:hypothetical protein
MRVINIGYLTSIEKGFKEKVSLPTGGERNGEWLGSDLPLPTGFAFAITPGITVIPILTLPAGFPSVP